MSKHPDVHFVPVSSDVEDAKRAVPPKPLIYLKTHFISKKNVVIPRKKSTSYNHTFFTGKPQWSYRTCCNRAPLRKALDECLEDGVINRKMRAVTNDR